MRDDDKDWVFLTGCNSSGTTMFEHVISGNPDVDCLPAEGQFLTPMPRSSAYHVGWLWTLMPEVFHLTEESDFEADMMLDHWYRKRVKRGDQRWILEKSPPDTIRTRWLQRVVYDETGRYPRFVHLVRNGYATTESILRRVTRTYPDGRFGIRDCAKHWNDSNEIFLSDSEHLEHVLIVRYEDLLGDYGETCGIIADFLDIPVDFPSPEELTPRYNHGIMRPYLTNYNDEMIARLTDEQLEVITGVARPMLEYFDYEIR